MADNIIIDNGELPDYTARSTDLGSGVQAQHIRIDVGAGTGEGTVSAENPLPTTSEAQDTANIKLDAIKSLLNLLSEILSPTEGGCIKTSDGNLENVFGTQNIINGYGCVKTAPLPEDKTVVRNIITGLGGQATMYCAGYSVAAVQISGTWSGTIAFEGSVNGGDFVVVQGSNIGGTLGYSGTTTSSGVIRFDIVGLVQFRIRFSSYNSGAATVCTSLSVNAGIQNISALPTSQVSYLTQKTTTNELNTYDTNVAATINPAANRAIIAPVAPTLPTTYVSNAFSKTPQIYQRVMVESAGSERLPFAQEAYSNRIVVAFPELLSMMEKIFDQLRMLNGQMAGLPLPKDFNEYQ